MAEELLEGANGGWEEGTRSQSGSREGLWGPHTGKQGPGTGGEQAMGAGEGMN